MVGYFVVPMTKGVKSFYTLGVCGPGKERAMRKRKAPEYVLLSREERIARRRVAGRAAGVRVYTTTVLTPGDFPLPVVEWPIAAGRETSLATDVYGHPKAK
jgi:hypothetical protein